MLRIRPIRNEYHGVFIRLTSIKWTHKHVALKRKILDTPFCPYCGIFMKIIYKGQKRLGRDTATTDHIVPKKRKPIKGIANTIKCCYSCNTRKGDKTLQEFKNIMFNGEKFWIEKIGGKIEESADPNKDKTNEGEII